MQTVGVLGWGPKKKERKTRSIQILRRTNLGQLVKKKVQMIRRQTCQLHQNELHH